jgi:hypothetical protein
MYLFSDKRKWTKGYAMCPGQVDYIKRAMNCPVEAFQSG